MWGLWTDLSKAFLGIKFNSSCIRPAFSQKNWTSYLDAAEKAMAGAGVDKYCPRVSVKKFLNRLLGMPVRMQNMIFSHFMSILEEKASKQASYNMRTQGATGVW